MYLMLSISLLFHLMKEYIHILLSVYVGINVKIQSQYEILNFNINKINEIHICKMRSLIIELHVSIAFFLLLLLYNAVIQ